MALKKGTRQVKKSKKGILLTLLTLVVFILMLGEVITYVVLNINYDNLSSSVAQSLASGNFAQNLDSGMGTFLYSSMAKSITVLYKFESTPVDRNDTFLNDSASIFQKLIANGTLYNTNSYFNLSFEKGLQEFEAEALTDGFTANLSNITLRVKQAAPFRLGVYATGLAALNTSSGITLDYPINANTTVSINSMPSLIGAEQGLNGTLQEEPLPQASVIGNLTAVSGSESPYMFAYGRVIYVSGEPACSGISSTYENSNYLLATPNAADINQNVCGMAGLITNISNSSTPLKPYLVYKNDSIMSYLQSNPNVLLNGASLQLYNTSAIQDSANGGFYYPSPYTASYLQRIQAQPYEQSPDGIFSFKSEDRNAANFSLTTQNITIPSLAHVAGSTSATMSAWVYIRSFPYHQIIFSDDWNSPNVLQMYVHKNGRLEADFGSGSAWINAANTSPGAIQAGKWYFVSATWASGQGEQIYVNGIQMPITYIVGNSISTGSLGTPGTGNIAGNQGNAGYFNGFIANEQIYNKSLSPVQIKSQFEQGINDIPESGSGLVAWYPLSSNANDYSGNGNDGIPSNVIYTRLTGYTKNPTGQQQQNYVAEAAEFNGTSSYIDGNAFAFPITATAWIYPTNYQSTASNLKTIMEVDGAPGSNGGNYQFFINRPGSSYCNGDPGVLFLWNPGASICTNLYVLPDKWNFVAFTVNSTDMKIFLNGKLYNYPSTNLVSGSANTLFVIGEQGARRYYNGSISNVQLYSQVFNYTELKALYKEGISGGPINSSSFVGWWPLNGNANDYSGNGNNGTSYHINYAPLELPASTSPLEGVFGCNGMSSCNSSSQKLYLSGLPLESAGMGSMNASTSLGMQDALVPVTSQFNGVGYDYAPIGSYFGNNNNLTAEAWVYATPNTNGPIFGVTAGGAASGDWNMPFLSENALTVHGWIWGVNNNEPINYTLPGPGWYNLIISYNATSASENFFVDGKSVGTGTGSYSPSAAFDYWTTYISGAKPTNVNNMLTGTVSDIQLYKDALSTSQAEQLYLNNSVMGIAPADYWPLGEGNVNLLNETENLVNATNFGYLYDSAVVACTNTQVVEGACGVEYVPG
ncbi:LamG domain-containing protein [Candidatus Marsarchaeota archaeon]|nr:LamG domain-containing protein [Candidatus Marsarchaeota archaeon]